MNKKNLLLIIFLILALLASLALVFRTTIFLGSAKTIPGSSTSLENSYLFASPIQAKADSKQLIRLTVFLLNSQGLGIQDQKVALVIPKNLTIKNSQDLTDTYGRAIFDLSSNTPGKYNIKAKVNSNSLPQTVNLIFY